MCKEQLVKGLCSKGPYCDLSHEPSPHRVPLCTYFLSDNCTNATCRYTHMTVRPDAPICVDFATLGYCEMGADCKDRHVFECPDYAATGSCPNGSKCRLPHIDRAGQLRQRAAKQQADTTAPAVGGSVLDGLDAALKASSKAAVISKAQSTFSQQDNFMSLDDDPEGHYEQRFA
ncbi:hypothetical protein BT63DRAFT_419551, partial [Microthyrium microscopicum]